MAAEDHSFTALTESSWPKITPYRLTSITYTLAIVIVKGVVAFEDKATLANVFDFLLGVGGVILYYIGFFETRKSRSLTWFFEEDCLLWFARRRRVPVEDDEALIPLVDIQSDEIETHIIPKPRDDVDTSGLRRRARWQKIEGQERLDEDALYDSQLWSGSSRVTTQKQENLTSTNDPAFTSGLARSSDVPVELQPARMIRFKEEWVQDDLDQAVSACRLVLAPGMRSRRLNHYIALSRLAGALLKRFDEVKTRPDLDEAIILYRLSLDETPWGHPDRGMNLTNVAIALQTRFDISRDLRDLDEAIFRLRSTLEICNSMEFTLSTHPTRFWNLTNLANATLTRFQHTRQRIDLEEAINYHRAALSLAAAESDHLGFDHPLALNNLSNALLVRFESPSPLDYWFPFLGLVFDPPLGWEDLEEALSSDRAALTLTPEGHSDRPLSLNNLAATLLVLSDENKDSIYLEEAISYNRMALELTPEGHPYRSGSLNNLAKTLIARFYLKEDYLDLDECIRNFRCVLNLTPSRHTYRPGRLENLAAALLARFHRSRNPRDLQEANDSNQMAALLRSLDAVVVSKKKVRRSRTGGVRDYEDEDLPPLAPISCYTRAMDEEDDDKDGDNKVG